MRSAETFAGFMFVFFFSIGIMWWKEILKVGRSHSLNVFLVKKLIEQFSIEFLFQKSFYFHKISGCSYCSMQSEGRTTWLPFCWKDIQAFHIISFFFIHTGKSNMYMCLCLCMCLYIRMIWNENNCSFTAQRSFVFGSFYSRNYNLSLP